MLTLAQLPAAPAAPLFKRFTSAVGEHLLIVPHSRLFDVPPELAAALDAQTGDALQLVAALAQTTEREAALDAVVAPTPQSLSLNVSASCNLACAYCYAGQGAFAGAQPAPMSWDIARAAIDRLFATADAQAPLTVGFLGGEPFVNRALIHQAVTYAASAGAARGLDVRFAVTTNGTLLNDADVALLRAHRFAVTVSVDGGAALHDAQRPLAGGQAGSFARLCVALRPLLDEPGQALIAARATVNRHDFNLRERFAAILAAGFPEAGFAPLRNAAPQAGALGDADWPPYLAALLELAQAEFARALQGENIRLTNFAVALKQLARGASSPYPCGAGGGYFSVAANGDWYACHRAIGAAAYRLGDNTGLDAARRQTFLTARHVHAQTDCQTCWARYLCSGGCHQEAAQRTAASCDFVRGWLEFCLRAYCELSAQRPQFFSSLEGQQ
ncbi:MAG: SPASM domain-containing protein [Acidobacteria bacterium]|nr:SPASM domain-containing protein [Acidobacteriota bacterium]MBI3428310.1 SPASM domain-containing protein [Acidobacteriota bacterium]